MHAHASNGTNSAAAAAAYAKVFSIKTDLHSEAFDLRAFIAAKLPIVPVRTIPELRLHHADSGSQLSGLTAADGREAAAPYWAYHWAGGIALARYILDRPETVAGRRVLDLGAGSGLVSIAAAKAGAREVIGADTDANALTALALNADLNGVRVSPLLGDLLSAQPLQVDLILVGDLFYERALAERVTRFLDRCLDDGADALVGDPGRAFLPLARLRPLQDFAVPDFGDRADATEKTSTVFAFVRA